MVAFEGVVKPLLFLHLVAAMVSLGSCLHFLLRLWRCVQSGGQYLLQVRLHARILAIAYVVVCVLGGLVYPTFRIRVRLEYLDAALPWATGLFEIKELGASLALLPAIGVWMIARRYDPRDSEQAHALPLMVVCAGFVLAILIFNSWCGWYLGTLRSV